MKYLITAYVNVAEDGSGRSVGYNGFIPYTHKVATVGYFLFEGEYTAEQVAERMFGVGNRMAKDDEGTEWPEDVRSLSVGDLLVIAAGDEQHTAWVEYLSVDRFGWVKHPSDVLHSRGLIVDLAGSNATSRPAVTP